MHTMQSKQVISFIMKLKTIKKILKKHISLCALPFSQCNVIRCFMLWLFHQFYGASPFFCPSVILALCYVRFSDSWQMHFVFAFCTNTHWKSYKTGNSHFLCSFCCLVALCSFLICSSMLCEHCSLAPSLNVPLSS